MRITNKIANMQIKNVVIFLGILIVTGFGFLYFTNNEDRSIEKIFTKDLKNLPVASESEIVELKNGDTYDLTASIVKKVIDGQEHVMFGYNGSIPGPLIKVAQGAEITINFKNEIDIDTTLHSHGIRLENKFDGVPGVTQESIKPGGTFTYKLKFPDAGIYWYHPHVREDYAQELGLYGNFLVAPENSDYWAEVDREETLFLDDILIANNRIAAFDYEVVDRTLMGRFGNIMLVNGDDNYKLNIKQGERVRFYVTNAANTRVFNFSIPNTRMKLVGGDSGRYEREEWVESVVLAPSERAVIEVWFDKSGEYEIASNTPNRNRTLGKISVNASPVTTTYFQVERINQDFIDSLNFLRPIFTKASDKSLSITVDMDEGMMGGGHMMPDGTWMSGHMMGSSEPIEWEDNMMMMNAASNDQNIKWKFVEDSTRLENMDIKWEFAKGDKIKLKIFNDPESAHPMQHPIHIHGQRFLVLNTNGVINNNLVWKDTALIRNGDTVELLVDMSNPGNWMIHCHIPEHMEAGMMAEFKVI